MIKEIITIKDKTGKRFLKMKVKNIIKQYNPTNKLMPSNMFSALINNKKHKIVNKVDKFLNSI